MPKTPKQAVAETIEPTSQAAPEQNSTDAPLAVNLPDDVTVKVEEVNQPEEAVRGLDLLPKAVATEVYNSAADDNLKRDFVHSVLAAREAAQPKEYTPPPIPTAIQRQTELEMQAGAARVAEFSAVQASRPRPPVQENATMQSVFRPEDYVPDQKKGQGEVPTSTFRTL